MTERAKWYVVHTYSGYENKVKTNIEKIIENRNLHDAITDIQVPMNEEIEMKDGKKKITLKKTYPGYVLIKMFMNEETWYVVRNTRGVTGFVGPESKQPVPLSDNEAKAMGIVEKIVSIDFEIGENVKVVTGPLESFVADIREINIEKRKVKVSVNMFGRDTIAELDFDNIEKVD
ncbi:MAG: transcription termination/antitermination protein NusG [Clostridiaceae bacterium]